MFSFERCMLDMVAKKKNHRNEIKNKKIESYERESSLFPLFATQACPNLRLQHRHRSTTGLGRGEEEEDGFLDAEPNFVLLSRKKKKRFCFSGGGWAVESLVLGCVGVCMYPCNATNAQSCFVGTTTTTRTASPQKGTVIKKRNSIKKKKEKKGGHRPLVLSRLINLQDECASRAQISLFTVKQQTSE